MNNCPLFTWVTNLFIVVGSGFLFQSIIHSFVCLLCGGVCMCHSSSMQVRGQLVGISSSPPPCGSQDSSSGRQAWWQVLYPVNHLASPGLSHFYECFKSHSLSLSPLTFPISLASNRHTFKPQITCFFFNSNIEIRLKKVVDNI